MTQSHVVPEAWECASGARDGRREVDNRVPEPVYSEWYSYGSDRRAPIPQQRQCRTDGRAVAAALDYSEEGGRARGGEQGQEGSASIQLVVLCWLPLYTHFLLLLLSLFCI